MKTVFVSYSFHMKNSCFLFVSLLMVLLFTSPAEAEPYKIGGRPWPFKTITYSFNSPNQEYSKGVMTAVKFWNSSNNKIKFREVKRNAKLKIVYAPNNKEFRSGKYAGWAHLGYVPKGKARVFLSKMKHGWLEIAAVTAHELGHSLGLDHSTGCQLMSYEKYDKCEWPDDERQWKCRLAEKGDMQGLRKLYGGTWKVKPKPFCFGNLENTSLNFSVIQNNISWNVSWTPSDPNIEIKRWIYSVGEKPDVCPVFDENRNYTSKPQIQAYFPDVSGTYCVSVWPVDNSQIAEKEAQHVWIDLVYNNR